MATYSNYIEISVNDQIITINKENIDFWKLINDNLLFIRMDNGETYNITKDIQNILTQLENY